MYDIKLTTIIKTYHYRSFSEVVHEEEHCFVTPYISQYGNNSLDHLSPFAPGCSLPLEVLFLLPVASAGFLFARLLCSPIMSLHPLVSVRLPLQLFNTYTEREKFPLYNNNMADLFTQKISQLLGNIQLLTLFYSYG